MLILGKMSAKSEVRKSPGQIGERKLGQDTAIFGKHSAFGFQEKEKTPFQCSPKLKNQ